MNNQNTKLTAKIILTITAMLAFWAGNITSYQIRAAAQAGLKGIDLIANLITNFEINTRISFASPDLITAAITVAFVCLIYFTNHVSTGQRREGEEHGSAKWGTRKDFKPFMAKTENQSVKITAEHHLNIDSYVTKRNINLLCIGGSGAGKSRSLVKPNIYTLASSFIITDPKGELLRDCGQYLIDHGYKVRCLNLVDFHASDKFNPLSYFNPEQPEVDCTILTENFITNTSGSKPASSDSFWEKAERALLTALISYEYALNRSQGTLNNVVDMLSKMQASEKDENAKSEVDLTFEAVGELIEEANTQPNNWSGQALRTLNLLRFSHAQYNTYLQGAGETKKSVIISLGVRLAPLHMMQIRNLLETDTIALDKVGKEKTALFMVIPDTHSAFTFLISIFYELFFETNIYQADHNPTGHLDIPVQCLMDEFANIGKMPSFERKIAVMRSRWISTMIIVQNLAQGKSLYKDNWETIIGNCDNFLFLGGNEKSTTEYVSKILGKQTIQTTDTSESKGKSGSFSKSNKRISRDLLSPDEIGRIPTDKCIYILRGVRPFYATKNPPAKSPAKPFTYQPARQPDAREPDLLSINIENTPKEPTPEAAIAQDFTQEDTQEDFTAPTFEQIPQITGKAGQPIEPVTFQIKNIQNVQNLTVKAPELPKGLNLKVDETGKCTIYGTPEEQISDWETELIMNYQLKP